MDNYSREGRRPAGDRGKFCWVRWLAVIMCLAFVTGCGSSEKDYQAAMDKGKAAFAAGTTPAKRQEAIECFTQAIAIKPDSAQAYLSRGHAYVKIRDLQKAFEDYDKAVSLDPTLAQAYYHRALTRIAMASKDEEAIKADLHKALELDSSIAAAGNLLMLYDKTAPGMSQ